MGKNEVCEHSIATKQFEFRHGFDVVGGVRFI